MKQAVEAQVLNPHFELGEQGLRQILSDVIEEVRRSVSQDIDGAEVLHSLLTSSWLQSLLKVYECLQRNLRESPAPVLDYASGLSLQLLVDIRSLPCCSEEAKELYCLLRQPHLQALLSAHDTVAQKDYDPALPPIPDEMPEDEEATRIVCLVKNNQPLFCGSPCAFRTRSLRSRISSDWSFHSDEVQSPTVERRRRLASCDARRSSFRPAEPLWRPAGIGPYPLTRCDPVTRYEAGCRNPMSGCRVCCYSDLICSTPSVYSSVRIENPEDELDTRTDSGPSTSLLSHPFYPNVSDSLQPDRPRSLQSPRIHTAPPSPMRPHRLLKENLVELAKQENLDELRTTVQLAASTMESSTKDIRVLGQKMTAATELMTETVQSLVLLTQGVDRLQTILTSSQTQINTVKPSDAVQSRCSSSSSSSSSLDTPSTSHTAHSLSASSHGSPRSTVKTKPAPLQQKKRNRPEAPLTNGVLEEPSSVKGGRSNQRKKKKKKPR